MRLPPLRPAGPGYTAATVGGRPRQRCADRRRDRACARARLQASRHRAGGPTVPPIPCAGPPARSPPLDAFELKSLIRTLLLPPCGLLLLAFFGLWLQRRRPLAGRRVVAAALILLWATSTYFVDSLLNRMLEAGQRPLDDARWAAARDGARPPGAIVVLAGGAVVDGPFEPRRERLHQRTLERVMAGARLAHATGLPVLVTGGRPDWLDHSEAELMRRVLEGNLGVKVRWLEDAARDTAENASLSAAMLRADGIDAIVLVTHAHHMARSQRAFEATGLAVVPAPHDWHSGPPGLPRPRDLLPSAQAAQGTWLALHELLGGLWYRLRGYG
jgi:uncharacterized SAM-binding protein YcdF (DUF218 family)